jgi:tRNA-guanine family transglycosylase
VSGMRALHPHLLKAGEMLGPRLVSLHNLVFMGRLMAEIRDAILAGGFAAWSRDALKRLRGAAGKGNDLNVAEGTGTLSGLEGRA